MLRCTRCERMYDEVRPDVCRYHSGRFVGSGAYALVPHWSCCGSELQLGGCKAAIEHMPCETTRRAMQSFVCAPVSVGTAPSLSDLDTFVENEQDGSDKATVGPTLIFQMPDATLSAAQQSQGSANKRDAKPPPLDSSLATAPDSIARYIVLPQDTFSAIALRHGMTLDQLAELNGMSATRCVSAGQALRVIRPALSDEDEEARRRREAILRFRRLHQCTVEEAKFYLEVNSFEWGTAVSERAADVAWEREHSQSAVQRLAESKAAEHEATLLVTELARSSSQTSKQGSSWPSWLPPAPQGLWQCLATPSA